MIDEIKVDIVLEDQIIDGENWMKAYEKKHPENFGLSRHPHIAMAILFQKLADEMRSAAKESPL